jgi:hypothetical protein
MHRQLARCRARDARCAAAKGPAQRAAAVQGPPYIPKELILKDTPPFPTPHGSCFKKSPLLRSNSFWILKEQPTYHLCTMHYAGIHFVSATQIELFSKEKEPPLIDQGAALKHHPAPRRVQGVAWGSAQRVARGAWLRARGAGVHIGDAVAGRRGGGCGHNITGGWVELVGVYLCDFVLQVAVYTRRGAELWVQVVQTGCP